jgi:hypothetical protein
MTALAIGSRVKMAPELERQLSRRALRRRQKGKIVRRAGYPSNCWRVKWDGIATEETIAADLLEPLQA